MKAAQAIALGLVVLSLPPMAVDLAPAALREWLRAWVQTASFAVALGIWIHGLRALIDLRESPL